MSYLRMDRKSSMLVFLSCLLLLMTVMTVLNQIQIQQLQNNLDQDRTVIKKRSKRDVTVLDIDISKIVEKKEFKNYVATAVADYLASLPLNNFCQLFRECKGNFSTVPKVHPHHHKGHRGPPGPRGPPGMKGEPGPKGDSGIGVFAPELKEYFLDADANASDSKILHCKFAGYPIPAVTWNHDIANAQQLDSVRIEASEVISRLAINNLTHEDSGNISCTARTILGQSKAEGTLNVHVRPSILCPVTFVEAYIGNTYTFPKCNITANPPGIISWKRGFGSLSSSRARVKNDHRLEISNLEVKDDGFYIIKVENYLGSTETTIQLKTKPMMFISKPHSIRNFSLMSKENNLTCVAGGNVLHMTGKWINLLKPLEELPSFSEIKGHHYSLTALVDEPGAYQCQFTDGKTKIQTTTVLQEISFEYDSDILTEHQVKTLFALVEGARGFTSCWKYESRFEEEDYRRCLRRSDSLTVVKDTSDIFGVFNDLDRTKSFGFDCRSDDECKKLSTSMDPICIENNPDGDSDSRDCNDEKDLIFKKFDDGAFKHRFKPLWADSDYDVTKIEVIIVN